MNERAQALVDRAREPYPEAWLPSPEHPEFVGVFLRLEPGHTSYGPCHVAVFQESETDQERAVWLLHTVLKNALARVKPEPGELVCIRSLGKRTPGGGGSAYEDYRVVVDRPDAKASWAALGADGDDFDPNDPGPSEPAPSDDDGVPF